MIPEVATPVSAQILESARRFMTPMVPCCPFKAPDGGCYACDIHPDWDQGSFPQCAAGLTFSRCPFTVVVHSSPQSFVLVILILLRCRLRLLNLRCVSLGTCAFIFCLCRSKWNLTHSIPPGSAPSDPPDRTLSLCSLALSVMSYGGI